MYRKNTTFKECVDYLYSFLNYEKKTNYSYGKSFDLKRVRKIFACLDINYKNLPVIHIAGTKAKGSTAHFIAFILAQSGLKVGLYTSPHIYDLTERIKILQKIKGEITDKKISKKSFSNIVCEFKDKLSKNKSVKGSATFFEVLTAVCLKYFSEQKLDCVILETGLGGRLDATNVCSPLVSVITHIGLDHTQILGRQIKTIAAEKAGIIKSKVPVVCSFQNKEVLDVIKRRAKKQKSDLYLLGKNFKIDNIKIHDSYSSFDFKSLNCNYKKIKVSLKGVYQIENAAVAIKACQLFLKGKQKEKNIKIAVKKTFIPGRFHVESKNPLTVVDCAHNKSSVKAFFKSLKIYYPEKEVILIFGACSDKDVESMLKQTSYKKIIYSGFDNVRSFHPEILAKIAGKKGQIAKNVKEAFKIALSYYNRKCLIVVCGSVFLASDVLKEIRRLKWV